MGQKAFISDADKALANLIWNSIRSDDEKAPTLDEVVALASPKSVKAGSRKLTIFLYNITQLQTEEPCALHYIVIPLTGNDAEDHELIERIINAISDQQIATTDGEGGVKFEVKMDSLSIDELSKLWVALGTPLKFSANIVVKVAGFQTVSSTQKSPSAEQSLQAFQLYRAVFKTFSEQSKGWKSRNIVLRQWIMQDFKKITDMTIDEMDAALDKLGGRLEQHLSTDQFIEPLNQLAAYYQHQLDELKGAQKVSSKQTGNVETVSLWLKEVKDLIQALSS